MTLKNAAGPLPCRKRVRYTADVSGAAMRLHEPDAAAGRMKAKTKSYK